MVGGCQRLTIAALLLVSTLVATTPGQAFTRNETVPQHHWMWGNLTWAEGRGGIAWGPQPTVTGDGLVPVLPTDHVDFTGQPIGQDQYLNPADLLQLDLFIVRKPTATGSTTAQCPRVEVRADERLLAGAHAASSLWSLPSAPAGHHACRYRMPLEEVHLPAGSVVRFRMTWVGASETFSISVSQSLPSVIRLPHFGLEEAIYRMPEVIPRLREAQGAPDEGAAALVARAQDAPRTMGVAGILLFLLPLARTRWRAIGAITVLLASGCLAPPAPHGAIEVPTDSQDRGEASVSYEEWDQDRVGTRVSLLGRVTDRYGFPVANAYVSLVGTPHSTQTAVYGTFSFHGLGPGDYRLRVNALTYVSIETDVPVVGGKVARVEVILAYDGSPDAAKQPHIHDYWHGEDQAVLIDAPLHRDCGGVAACYDFDQFYPRPRDVEERGLIRPGTIEVRLTLRFEAERACYTRLGLAVQENSDPDPANWTYFLPRESGVPFQVKTTWEMTDVGHQLFSTWTFRTFGAPADRFECGPAEDQTTLHTLLQSAQDAVLGPPVLVERATLVIQRGALPLEPKHPEHWSGRESQWIARGLQRKDPDYFINPLGPAVGSLQLATCLADAPAFEHDLSHPILGPPKSIVPPETKAVLLFLNQSRSNGGAGVAIYDWQLWYKTGETAPTPYVPGNPDYKRAPEPVVSSDGRQFVWRIPVSDLETDGIYNKKSAWRFQLVPSNLEARCMDWYLHSHARTLDPGLDHVLGYQRMSWDVVATRAAR